MRLILYAALEHVLGFTCLNYKRANEGTPTLIPSTASPSRSTSSGPGGEARRAMTTRPEFVGARLTRHAYALGLALALPERVHPAPDWVLARPTGVERADAMNYSEREATLRLFTEGA